MICATYMAAFTDRKSRGNNRVKKQLLHYMPAFPNLLIFIFYITVIYHLFLKCQLIAIFSFKNYINKNNTEP
jgi:hypothetical protein